MRRRIWLFGALLLLATVAFAIACSDDDDDDDEGGTQGAESELCNDLAALNTALQQMRSLNSSSSVDDAREAEDNVKKAFDDVKESAKDVKDARVDQVEDAYDDLASAVNSISGSQTLGQAATTVQTEASAAVQAEQGLRSTLRCP